MTHSAGKSIGKKKMTTAAATAAELEARPATSSSSATGGATGGNEEEDGDFTTTSPTAAAAPAASTVAIKATGAAPTGPASSPAAAAAANSASASGSTVAGTATAAASAEEESVVGTTTATTATATTTRTKPKPKRRTVRMEWNSALKIWKVVEGTRDKTKGEKYDSLIQWMVQNVDDRSTIPDIYQDDLAEVAAANAAPTAEDPFLSPFFKSNGGLGLRTKIFGFLEPEDLVQCRSVSKDWYCWGLQVLMDPNHPKKAFPTEYELNLAVNAYLRRPYMYQYDDHDDDDYVRLPPLVQGERYDPTNDTHVRLFQVQCLYGPVIGKWNVSLVTSFISTFYLAEEFNEPLEWDTRNAKSMLGMFHGCETFNCSLGPNFDTSNVTNMSSMFDHCKKFNQDLSSLNTSKVTDMSDMFRHCENFNQDVSSFNTSKVTDMSDMFFFCENFNQDVSSFNTSKVIHKRGMFSGCISLRRDFRCEFD